MQIASLRIQLSAALMSAALWLGGCGHHHELPEIDCATAAVPSFSQLQSSGVLDKCTGCHSSQLSGSARNGAPEGMDFDSYEAAKHEAEHCASAVHSGEMPPGGGMPEAEQQALYAWALCGTPQ